MVGNLGTCGPVGDGGGEHLVRSRPSGPPGDLAERVALPEVCMPSPWHLGSLRVEGLALSEPQA